MAAHSAPSGPLAPDPVTDDGCPTTVKTKAPAHPLRGLTADVELVESMVFLRSAVCRFTNTSVATATVA